MRKFCEFISGGSLHPLKSHRMSIGTTDIHSIQKQHMKVNSRIAIHGDVEIHEFEVILVAFVKTRL